MATGADRRIQKWQIPHNLCSPGSLLRGRELQKAVEEAGYVYIQVVIKTLYGPTEDHCTALGLGLPATAGE